MRFVCVDVDADAHGFGCTNCFGNWHARLASRKAFAAAWREKKFNRGSNKSAAKNSLRQKLRGVLLDLKQFPRCVVVEAAYCFADVLAAIDLRLVLPLPRLHIHHRHSSVEGSEVLRKMSLTKALDLDCIQRLTKSAMLATWIASWTTSALVLPFRLSNIALSMIIAVSMYFVASRTSRLYRPAPFRSCLSMNPVKCCWRLGFLHSKFPEFAQPLFCFVRASKITCGCFYVGRDLNRIWILQLVSGDQR